jgi:O-antigen biosynthesis protein
VNTLKRFDLDGMTQIPDSELNKRWKNFFIEIRFRSGNLFERILYRMFGGEETLRHKIAQVPGRHVLKFARALRGTRNTSNEPVVLTEFPIGYDPTSLLLDAGEATSSYQPREVEVFVFNEAQVSASETIKMLNEKITSSQATWLFLVDSTISDAARALTLSHLMKHAENASDVVFSDETNVNPRFPILKPNTVGPHTLLSYNIVGRPALLSISKLRMYGGFSTSAGWAFEHDFYLRLSEQRGIFQHVPLILPAGRTQTALSADHLNNDTCAVVNAALARRKWNGDVSIGTLPGLVQWKLSPPSPQPSIEIVIPTRDRLELVLQCIAAVEDKTTYSNYSITILDNDSKDPDTLAYFESTTHKVVACPGPFNYAKIINRGIKHSTADFIVTLNNDTILQTPDWLERMVGLASLPDVGIVGSKQVESNGHSEHESVVITPYPQHLRSDGNYPYRDHFILATKDVAAVTGAVQMFRRNFWESIGGMDEELTVVMNDIDVCLRAQLEGRNVVYTPDVIHTHNAGSTRGKLDPKTDRNRFLRRWDIFGSFQDPYFPPLLKLFGETFYYIDPQDSHSN